MVAIDGDIIAYRCSMATQNEPEVTCAYRIDEMMSYCIDKTVGFDLDTNHRTYLTGKDNFRYDLAKTYDYKGNRKDTEKPKHLPFARQHLTDKWSAITSEGCEADDLIAEIATFIPDCAIASQDKDFNTVEGWKYNFVTDTWRYDTKETALEFFYEQILTGDRADNIVGIYRVGPVKARKIMKGWSTEKELFDRCVEEYMISRDALMINPEDKQKWAYERVVENARLLHLRRHEDEVWEPPK